MKQYLADLYNDNREWFSFAGKLFLFACVIGALAFLVWPGLIGEIAKIFQSKFGDKPPADLTLAREIFTQNLIASLIAMLGGVVLGITAFVVIFFNGFIVGYVVLNLLALKGNAGSNALLLVAGLVPHGIFEIPAFLLAAAIGLRLGIEWTRGQHYLHRGEVFKSNLKRVLYALPVVVILLVIAAILEVFVSGQLVNKLS